MTDIVIELIKLIPSVLWIILIATILAIFYRPIKKLLVPRLAGIKAFGVELSFLKDSIDAALDKAKAHDKLQLAEKSPQWQVEVPEADKQLVLRRALQHQAIFNGAQLLWVDDHPENNLNERKMFKQLNMEVDTARSTTEALEMLKFARYDLILSDMARGEQAAAGLDFLTQLRKTENQTPVIFYIGVFNPDQGVPGTAFGITNRPDELLHLVLDALERKKY